MSTLREAAQQALEALEIGYDSARAEAAQYHAAMAGYRPERHAAMDADVAKIAKAITALKAALAQEREQEQEPVAWLRRQELADLKTCNYRHLGADSPRIWAPHQPDAPDPESDLVAVYAAPPRREWQSLTDADYDSICDNHSTLHGAGRAIEAKLKEKNHG